MTNRLTDVYVEHKVLTCPLIALAAERAHKQGL